MLEQPYEVENCEILDYKNNCGHYATICPHCHKKHFYTHYFSTSDYPKLRRDIVCNWCERHYCYEIRWH